ncbi:hypothetical protein ABT332_13505 [Saccharomonospora azurea]|uniref:hypothetical protein n=1 Tax=Saccharomonospora azurea TaxID=40988 RepID=UPI00332A5017
MTETIEKKPVNARVLAKIEHLHRLINHARTSEAERAAAERALKRLTDAYSAPGDIADKGPGKYVYLWNPGAWEGEKYGEARNLTLTQIAKLIREDLKLARKVGRKTAPKTGEVAIPDPIGDAPKEIKFSVRTEYYSGGGSIHVGINNIPEEWGWTLEEDHYGDMVPTATPAMAALYRAVKRIYNAYNYDNSDIQTDYFDRRYGGHVSTDPAMRFPGGY